jgi:hypothetical protein
MVTGLLLQVVKTEKSFCFLFPLWGLPSSCAHLDCFPAETHLLALLAGWLEGPASFAKVSAILLALWAEVEGPVGRIGASGVGRTAAGDGLALGGFWPATFLLLCMKSKSQIRTC